MTVTFRGMCTSSPPFSFPCSDDECKSTFWVRYSITKRTILISKRLSSVVTACTTTCHEIQLKFLHKFAEIKQHTVFTGDVRTGNVSINVHFVSFKSKQSKSVGDNVGGSSPKLSKARQLRSSFTTYSEMWRMEVKNKKFTFVWFCGDGSWIKRFGNKYVHEECAKMWNYCSPSLCIDEGTRRLCFFLEKEDAFQYLLQMSTTGLL